MKPSTRYCVIDLNEPLRALFEALKSERRLVASWLNDWLGEEVSLDEAVKCLSSEADVKLEIQAHANSIRLEYGEGFGKATEVFCEALFKRFKLMGLYEDGKLVASPFQWYGPFLILELS